MRVWRGLWDDAQARCRLTQKLEWAIELLDESGHRPVLIEQLTRNLSRSAFQVVRWRQGCRGNQSSRFRAQLSFILERAGTAVTGWILTPAIRVDERSGRSGPVGRVQTHSNVCYLTMRAIDSLFAYIDAWRGGIWPRNPGLRMLRMALG